MPSPPSQVGLIKQEEQRWDMRHNQKGQKFHAVREVRQNFKREKRNSNHHAEFSRSGEQIGVREAQRFQGKEAASYHALECQEGRCNEENAPQCQK